jgi:hypothetical protein
MGEFADTYDGDIQACLRGLVGGAPPDLEIDRETRKRKWLVKVNAPLRMVSGKFGISLFIDALLTQRG